MQGYISHSVCFTINEEKYRAMSAPRCLSVVFEEMINEYRDCHVKLSYCYDSLKCPD